MAATVEELVSRCFDELHLSQRFTPFVEQAKAEGYPQLAKLFRALAASEEIREALYRQGAIHHAGQSGDFYVCPHCGLVYYLECPDQCLVDETLSKDFVWVQ